MGALACARRRNTCLTISQAESRCSRAVANEAVKEVFEVGSERQCCIQKCGQTLLDVNIRASTRGPLVLRARMSRNRNLTHRRRLSSLPEGGGIIEGQREQCVVELSWTYWCQVEGFPPVCQGRIRMQDADGRRGGGEHTRRDKRRGRRLVLVPPQRAFLLRDTDRC